MPDDDIVDVRELRLRTQCTASEITHLVSEQSRQLGDSSSRDFYPPLSRASNQFS